MATPSPLLGYFGPLVPGGGLSRVVEAGTPSFAAAAFPSLADQWTASYTSQSPSGIWTTQDAAAPARDRVGANDFELTGALDFRQAGDPDRFAIGGFGVGDDLSLADAEAGDADAATSVSLWLRLRVPAVSGTGVYGFGHKKASESGLDPGWYVDLVRASGNLRLARSSGSSNAFLTASADHRDGWHDVFIVFDRGAGEVRFTTGLASDSASDAGDFGNASPITIGTIVAGVSGWLVTYAALWDGYALTAAEVSEILAVTSP
jgi:hypothetical protein